MSIDDESTSRLPVPDLLRRAEEVWTKAQVVRTDPPFQGEPEASHLSKCLAARGHEAEEALIQLLYNENPLVCAYALWTLFKMESAVFGWLPEELMNRKESVTIITGSFSNRNNLGGWAAHLRKRSRPSDSEREEQSG